MKKLTLSLGGIVAALIAALVLLCFFQFPSLDDYVASYLKQKIGQPQINTWYLTHMNGRYTTIPFFFLVCGSKFLMDHYALPLLFFTGITIFSFYYFVSEMAKQLLVQPLGKAQRWLVTGIFLLICCSIIPEVASFLFWLPAVITYTIPFCLFLFYLITWSRFFQQAKPYQTKQIIRLCILTLLLGGCNEWMMFLAFGFPFLVIVMMICCGHLVPRKIWIVIMAAILMAILVLTLPGNNQRTNEFQQTQPLLTSLTGSIFRTWQFFLLLLSNPLFYISCAGMFLIAAFLKPSITAWFSNKKTNWLLELACLVTIILCFDVIIRQLANYVVPERVNNIKVCVALTGVWWIILMNAGMMKDSLQLVQRHLNKFKSAWICLFIAGILGSVFFRELITNLLVAPMHITIVEQRVKAIEKAKAEGKKSVYFAPYEKDAEAVVRKKFKNKTRFVMEEFRFPPSFSFFMNDAFDKGRAYFYAEYYGIDSVVTDTGKYARWGLTDKFPNNQTTK